MSAIALLIAGCGEPDPERVDFVSSVSDSGGVKILTFDIPLDFRNAEVAATELEADLTLGGVTDGFGHIADVVGFDDGRFAVLDRDNLSIALFTPAGTVYRQFGRKGQGPGEFADPLALARFGDKLVVRDSRTRAPLVIFDTTGRVVATGKAIPDGDWATAGIRSVGVPVTDAPYYMPAEDITARFIGIGPSGFAYVLQSAPDMQPDGESESTAYLIRFDSLGVPSDTIDRAPGPRDYPSKTRPGQRLDQAWYVGRPLWAAGANWFARAHGDSTTIAVTAFTNAEMLSIRLSPTRLPIRDIDKEAFAKWYYSEGVMKHGSAENIALLKGIIGTSREKRYTGQIVENLRWAEMAPTVSALYGDGRCLWIAGFAPQDYPTGRSLTWIRVNVETAEVKVVRIPRRGARVREFAGGFVYVTYHDSDGVQYLERYESKCN